MVALFVLKLFVLFAFFPADAAAGDYRCADAIVSIGDTGSELLMRCGEPGWKQVHTEKIVETAGDSRRKITIPVEEWTYDLGPDRFARIFTLRSGKVADIRTGDYGKREEQRGLPCGDRVISVGDTAAEVRAKCGEPFRKETREEEDSKRIDDNAVRRVSVMVEEWTYDFGPDRFVRIFTFRNGTITDIRTGGYGSQRVSEDRHPEPAGSGR